MGNRIECKNLTMKCSNGGTYVFLTVLALSGAKLAESDDEKNLIIWLSEHDQKYIGLGCAGFDLLEAPWNMENPYNWNPFQKQKAFLLSVIADARTKTGWETLDYTPNEERVSYYLDEFQKLVNAVNPEDIDDSNRKEWLASCFADDPVKNHYPKCRKHGIYLTCYGCIACNDGYV